jgi:hypothetical protein
MAPLNGKIILFGGTPFDGSGGPVADTWSWDGARWTELSVAGPGPRANAVMAPLDGELVLFGGAASHDEVDDYSDTWTWDGSAWTRHIIDGPSARNSAVMAPLGGKLFLFGGRRYGYSDAGVWIGLTALGDMWTWDGTAWTEVSSGGPLVSSSVMVPLGGRLVLYGGLLATDSSLPDTSSTWLSDGSGWSLASTAGPTARDQAVMGVP